MPDRTICMHSVFATFAVGGPQRRFAALANHFGARYRHIVTAIDGRYDADALLQPGLDWRRQEFPEARQGLRRSYIAARRVLRELRPDVLVTNNWGSIEWAAANRPKVVRHIHIEDGFGPDEAAGQLPRRILFRRFALGGRSVVVLPSQTLMGIARDIWRLPERKLRYVPNGIACARFDRPADPDLAASLAGCGPVIGTVAALRREKAIDRLIRAFAAVREHRPCVLAIVGEGQERPMLEALVRTLGIGDDVVFVGHLAAPERILGAFDVFAMSSDTEQMPLTLLEAMAAGRPAACTDVGDIKAMLAPENRDFVVAKDNGALAAALARLLDAPEAARAIGAANRARARSVYDDSLMFAAYDRLFSGAV
ncbi:MAG: glycosyltransferase [Rhodospirillaceae bacterium]|nr:glycosyltransferase [Rhodospirillaceae bacterium]